MFLITYQIWNIERELSKPASQVGELRASVSKNRPLTTGVKNEFSCHFGHELHLP